MEELAYPTEDHLQVLLARYPNLMAGNQIDEADPRRWLMIRPPFNDEIKRKELLSRLNKIPGVSIPEKAMTRRPSIFLSLFSDASSLKQLLETLDWVVNEIKSS